MKKNHFIARKGLFSLALAAVGAMFLGSCAAVSYTHLTLPTTPYV